MNTCPKCTVEQWLNTMWFLESFIPRLWLFCAKLGDSASKYTKKTHGKYCIILFHVKRIPLFRLRPGPSWGMYGVGTPPRVCQSAHRYKNRRVDNLIICWQFTFLKLFDKNMWIHTNLGPIYQYYYPHSNNYVKSYYLISNLKFYISLIKMNLHFRFMYHFWWK